MESAPTHRLKRTLRVLLAGGILASAWVAVDAITHSEPAAAAETIDILPIGDGHGGIVSGVLDEATGLVESAVAPVTAVTTPVAAPLAATVVEPVITTVVTPIATPVLTAVAPVVDAVTAPLTPVTDVLSPLTPVVVTVLEPIAPVVGPLLPVAPSLGVLGAVVATTTDLVATIPALSAITPNGTVLAVGGALVLGTVLAASATPLLPAPSNGGPLKLPVAPAAPTGSNGSTSVANYGELNSGLPAGTGASGTVGPDVDELPSSPTFASDTTPD